MKCYDVVKFFVKNIQWDYDDEFVAPSEKPNVPTECEIDVFVKDLIPCGGACKTAVDGCYKLEELGLYMFIEAYLENKYDIELNGFEFELMI